ncbi:glucosamine-6-phosphate deaminase [Lysinibacillus boronitolerans]|uniref:Glucosamine-6-phosphate deaminase n=1 Tax=Lysinibacillus boronitolerans JCM 21713 = 10a = NBRC 103108 TaxID=1294264 RepID=A0ABR4Y3F2_9BACI|nr:glucosamine-6-phosphate deaminase [Lysinibacillus boronitolerans]KGR88375.1 glucosamine-6-phosphate deaminase [Lysinibacillus boronitolerans JCM 21713 = 10a = NBRC 103108]MCS1390537.1 glucosamine-6-phosphate deaminase [Lysinibacillus boronitolerans]
MKWIEVNTYEELSEVAATIFSKQIQEKPDSVLGLATGGSPVGMYKKLVARHQAGHLSFKKVQTFNLDEYVGLEQTSPASYFTFMHENLFNFVDIQPENIHLPNGKAANLAEECAAYDKRIEEAGGIDLQLLGIGVNGHIAFNEPGTSFDSKTNIVELTESTRTENAIYFDDPSEVPTHAITMGIQSIMKAKEIILIAFGEKKLPAIEKLKSGHITEEFPASQLLNHPNVTIIYGGTN